MADTSTGLELLELPADFEYTSFGWTGDPLDAGTPTPTPSNHDGMGCFRLRRARLGLVRNHEIAAGAPLSSDAPLYDPRAGGGTSTLIFDARAGELRRHYASLAGTVRNCAGGATPWRSWISCEETTDGPGNGPLERETWLLLRSPAAPPSQRPAAACHGGGSRTRRSHSIRRAGRPT